MTRSILTLSVAMLLALLVGCAAQPKPAAGLASLRVHVIAEQKAGRPAQSQEVSVYDTPSAAASSDTFALVDYATLDDIVVWLEPVGQGAAIGTTAVANINVDSRHPSPDLAKPVCVGQTVVFRNAGDRPQGIYSVSDGNNFDLGSVAPGATGQFVVQAAGLIEVLTDTSKDPLARIYAGPTRWVAMGHSGGNIDFADVTPGSYHLMSWHPRLPGSEQDLTLSPDQVASASIKVGVNALPKIGGR